MYTIGGAPLIFLHLQFMIRPTFAKNRFGAHELVVASAEARLWSTVDPSGAMSMAEQYPAIAPILSLPETDERMADPYAATLA